MNVIFEKKEEMIFIGYHTEIRPEEAYQKCPEFWDKEYAAKYTKLWQSMKPETPVEKAVLENEIGMFGICADSNNAFTYWIAGLYKGGEIPEGLEIFKFPASEWAIFKTKGPIPESLQTLNTEIWKNWIPTEGKKYNANVRATLEVYSAGNPLSSDYECSIWIPLGKR